MKSNTRFGRSLPPDFAKLGAGLMLGWGSSAKKPLGFQVAGQGQVETKRELIVDQSEGHTCCVAPTRSGKSRSVIVPNGLCYPGPAIFLDPKAEHAQVLSKRRMELKQEVYYLDPTKSFTQSPARLNPLDVLRLPNADLEADACSLAELLARGYRGSKEPFWDLQGTALLSALIIHAAEHADPEKRTLKSVIEMLNQDDTCYQLAVTLDQQGKTMNRLAYQTIASVLQMPEVTRGGVIASTQAYMKPLMSQSVLESLGTSTISLQDIIDGKPLSVFLILPPHRLSMLRGLLKVQLGAILMALMQRQSRPALPTWLVLDEIGQLESFPLIESMLTLSAGYSVRVSMFWQDLAQLSTYYPESWRTILNNCSVCQAFGIYNRSMATQWGDYLDIHPSELMRLGPEEQVVHIHGRGTIRCERLDYLRDFPRDFYGVHRMHQGTLSGAWVLGEP